MEFDEVPEFQREVKQLVKKFNTLKSDLEVLKKVLAVSSRNHPEPPFSYRISGLGFELPIVIKIKKFACRSLKGRGANTGIRIIYAFSPEKQLVQFLQIYFKADHENEDRDRILRHVKAG